MAQDETFAPEIATFEGAARHVGCKSGSALRMRFRRKLYPETFLIHITPRVPGVAVRELVDWIKAQRQKPEQETHAG